MTIIFHHLAVLILCLMRFYVRAETQRYIIYPREELSLQARQQFTQKLNEVAGPQGNVYTSIRRPNSVRREQEIRFWCADLTETAYNKLRKDEQVRTTERIYYATNNR